MSVIIPPNVIAAAQASDQATGIPASVTIAQWAAESGWGKVCTGTNNYFGIKAVTGQAGTMCQTHEVIGGKSVPTYAMFANYDSLADAFTAHAKLLADGPQYAAARAELPDVTAFVDKMAAVYATDPHYASLLNEIIADHLLMQYDS